jgi:hypothetical protein
MDFFFFGSKYAHLIDSCWPCMHDICILIFFFFLVYEAFDPVMYYLFFIQLR